VTAAHLFLSGNAARVRVRTVSTVRGSIVFWDGYHHSAPKGVVDRLVEASARTAAGR
jgi:hypothetical protein